MAHPTHAVRPYSNHYNLDSGAYFTNALLMVNHSAHRVDIMNGAQSSPEPFVSRSQVEIQNSLTKYQLILQQKKELSAKQEAAETLLSFNKSSAPAEKVKEHDTSSQIAIKNTVTYGDSLSTFGKFASNQPLTSELVEKNSVENHTGQKRKR
jgi:transcriptional regulator of acetoin/glycerol metabolism